MASPELTEIRLGLDRITRVLNKLGNPQKNLPPTIHIAGTNGKGSVAAYLTAIFQCAGYSVHRFTSPHLVRFNERILLAGKEISDERFSALLAKITEIDETNLTPFEVQTAAAFIAMSEEKADIAIIETGLGGRLDATNVVTPQLSIITPVDFDHTEFLGDTIEKIAFEKAGIIKQNTPCIVGKQKKEALKIIAQVANSRMSELVLISDTEINFEINPSLAGIHQIDNAKTASLAAINLREKFPNITDLSIQQGISSTKWLGRLQKLEQTKLNKLLPENSELWLDGGHNAQGGEILTNFLQNKPNVYLICAMMKDKDTKAFLSHLKAVAKNLYGVAVPENERSKSAEEIVQTALALGIEAKTATRIEEALVFISSGAKENFNHANKPLTIVICGSLYLAGYVLGAY